MTTDQRNPIPLPNGNNLTTTSMYCGVNVDSSGNAALPSAGGAIAGVMYGLSGTSTAISARTPGDGSVKLQYGGTVTLPATLKVNSSGQFLQCNAADLAAGAGVAIALEAGASGEVHKGVLIGGASPFASVSGVDDVVLNSNSISNTTVESFVQVTGTKTGTLAAGIFAGQTKRITQSVAATTPVGTITGTFKTLAGGAATTLALGTAVAQIADLVWDGAAWRLTAALGGTASGLS